METTLNAQNICTFHMFVYNNKSKGANNSLTYVSEHIAKRVNRICIRNYFVITNQLNRTHLNQKSKEEKCGNKKKQCSNKHIGKHHCEVAMCKKGKRQKQANERNRNKIKRK